MDPKWIQNGTKMDPKWSPNERKSNSKECKTKPKLMPSPSSPSPPSPQSSNVAKDVSCRGTPRKSREAAGNRRTRQKDARSHGQPTETVDTQKRRFPFLVSQVTLRPSFFSVFSGLFFERFLKCFGSPFGSLL